MPVQGMASARFASLDASSITVHHPSFGASCRRAAPETACRRDTCRSLALPRRALGKCLNERQQGFAFACIERPKSCNHSLLRIVLESCSQLSRE